MDARSLMLQRRILAFPALLKAADERGVMPDPNDEKERLRLICAQNPRFVQQCAIHLEMGPAATAFAPGKNGDEEPCQAAIELALREELSWALWLGEPEDLAKAADEALRKYRITSGPHYERSIGTDTGEEAVRERLLARFTPSAATRERARDYEEAIATGRWNW